jgi:hypothetical protein
MTTFGPKRRVDERLSEFRWRMTTYCLRWAPGAAVLLAASIYVLRQGRAHDWLWVSAVFLALLAGFAMAMASVSAAAFLVGWAWARLRESSPRIDNTWKLISLITAAVLLTAVWGVCVWYVIPEAISEHAVPGFSRYGRHLIHYTSDPKSFAIHAIGWAFILIMMPVLLVRALWIKRRSRSVPDPAPASHLRQAGALTVTFSMDPTNLEEVKSLARAHGDAVQRALTTNEDMEPILEVKRRLFEEYIPTLPKTVATEFIQAYLAEEMIQSERSMQTSQLQLEQIRTRHRQARTLLGLAYAGMAVIAISLVYRVFKLWHATP